MVSAGNEAESHWSGTFSGGGDTFHDFAPGDEGIGFALPANAEACVFLKWDAWPTTTVQDFDLGIYDATTSELVAASTEDQVANNTSPTEATCIVAPAGGRQYYAVIERYAGTAPRMDLFVDGARFDEYRVAAGSLLEPASAPETLAVAAMCWGGNVEPYSSQGPTIDGRVKPDVAGFDSTSSVVYGAFSFSTGCGASGFTGTSAAAPHVAGAAAILHQRGGPLTAAQLQARLEGTAEDFGAVGKDVAFGAGRLRLPVPPKAVTATAEAVGRRVARLRGFVTPNRWPGTYRWEYSTDPTFATFSTTIATAFAADGDTDIVSFALEGLEPTTTYHARFVAQNDHGTATSAAVSFTTADTAPPYVSVSEATGVSSSGATLHGVVNPNGLETTYRFWYGTSFPPSIATTPMTLTWDTSHAAPTATTGAASSITSSAAVLAGAVNPGGDDTTYQVQYGPTTAYGSTAPVPAATAGFGTADVPVVVALSGLSASTLYHYRFVATNSKGVTEGLDRAFTTAAPPPPGGGGGGGGGGSALPPDLELTVGHGSATVAAGESFTYGFVIRNKGAGTAHDTTLTLTLPDRVEYGGASVERGSGCRQSSGQTYVCALDFLGGGQSTPVRIGVRLRENGELRLTGSVSSREQDVNPADNAVTYAFTVGPQAPPTPPSSGPTNVTRIGTAGPNVLRGGAGNDLLRGLGGNDRLYGGAGNDRLFGGAGNDRLEGHRGRDLLDGGIGRDTFVARDRATDTIRCGAGRDVVIADRNDRVARDCEVVRRG